MGSIPRARTWARRTPWAYSNYQHQTIFALAVEAAELSRNALEFETLRRLMDRIGETLHDHFLAEEAYLADIGFPGLEAHRADHRAILAETEYLQLRMASGGAGWALNIQGLTVMNFMLGVTVGHILTGDALYAQFMAEAGLRTEPPV